MDLPVQHSSNKIRKKMGRKGTREEIIDVISRLRQNIPDIALRTSLIVGFPGETEEDFKDLLNFIKKVKFERLGVFKYSREENTEAASFGNQIEESVKEQRYKKIMQVQQEISLNTNEQFLNETLPVIIDEVYDDYAVGRSEYDAPEIDNQIIIKNTELTPGNFIKCKMVEAYEYDLVGEIIS